MLIIVRFLYFSVPSSQFSKTLTGATTCTEVKNATLTYMWKYRASGLFSIFVGTVEYPDDFFAYNCFPPPPFFMIGDGIPRECSPFINSSGLERGTFYEGKNMALFEVIYFPKIILLSVHFKYNN